MTEADVMVTGARFSSGCVNPKESINLITIKKHIVMQGKFFRRIYYRLQFILILFYCSSATAIDPQAAVSMRHLRALSLDELMDIQVMSVAKKYAPLSKTAAAIHVITQEDIRRSGAVSIPEALRMVPGMNVARIDANKWAISVRGFNGRYSNKLLVLIDGREVYHPAFSGVLWDTRDLMLEDLDRIEIIRGPGATIWGSNAVNGVINVISKSAVDTQGGRLVTYTGSENNQVALRYGGEINENTHYRIYTKYLKRDSGANTEGAGQGHDGQNMTGAGFRVDWQGSINDRFTLDGRYYNSSAGLTYHNPTLNPPLYFDTVITDETEKGGHLSVDWKHTYPDTSEHNLKIYYQHQDRKMPYFDGKLDNFHIDFNHHLQLFEDHDIVWGAGYRYYHFDTNPGLSYTFTPSERHLHTFNVFLQDEIELVDDGLWLTLGSKLESTYFSGFNAQPSLRLLWTPDERQSVWFAVSRALRTPAIRENDLTLYLETDTETFGVPAAIYATSNPDLEPESLTAYELGYRVKVNSGLTVDITGFYNNYRNLVTYSDNATADYTGLLSPQPYFRLLVPPSNSMDAETYGVELAGRWQVSKAWRLHGAYSYLKMNLHDHSIIDLFENEFPEGLSPQQQLSIRSSYDLTKNTEIDFWLRYVDALPKGDIDHYLEMDIRFSWYPTDSLELSLVGKNLLDSDHSEFDSDILNTQNSAVERSLLLKLDWSF